MLLYEALTVRAFQQGRLDAITLGVYGFVPLSIFVRGLITCTANERAFRPSYRQERIIGAQQREIEREHERAEALLHNILPATIAARLKLSPAMIADRFEDVTVLFADVVGFTPLAANVAPERLVGLLDDIFTRFDDLSLRLGVEKVKTIGDAYMAVAGLPEVRVDHASVVAELALGMDRYRFEDRGPIDVKGKGEMPTWLLLGPMTAAM